MATELLEWQRQPKRLCNRLYFMQLAKALAKGNRAGTQTHKRGERKRRTTHKILQQETVSSAGQNEMQVSLLPHKICPHELQHGHVQGSVVVGAVVLTFA